MPTDLEAKKLLTGGPWAQTGDRTDPDDASLTPTLSRATGWPQSFSDEGGNTPRRRVFNQLLREITGAIVEFYQTGVVVWDADVDYVANATVQAGGFLWRATVATGPTTSNATDPTADGQTVWTKVAGSVDTPLVAPAPTAIAGQGQIIWVLPPPRDRGAQITAWKLRWRRGSTGTWTTLDLTVPYVLVTGLTNGQAYQAQAQAINSAGAGPWSPSTTSTPAAQRPEAPVLRRTTPGDGRVQVVWSNPHNGGATITSYLVQWRSGNQAFGSGQQARVTGELATSHTVTSLTNNTDYTFRVAAVNRVGTGAWSNQESSTPRPAALAPAKPSAPIGSPGQGQVSWRWGWIDDRGADITGFRFQQRESGDSWPGSSDGLSVACHDSTGLTNGTTYEARIAAVNSVGTGAWSDAGSATPQAEAPDRVAAVIADLGDTVLTLGWGAPNTNGADISSYLLHYSTDSSFPTSGDAARTAVTLTTITQVMSHEITGLDNDVELFFRVRAINARGSGPWSPTGSGTPFDPVSTPGPPRNLSGVPHATRGITWTWDDPASDGGSPITGHQVQTRLASGSYSGNISDVTTATHTSTINAPYFLRVRSVNVEGEGPWSGEVAAPLAKPGTPTMLAGAASGLTVNWTWTAPAHNGSPIIRYEVQQRIAGSQTWTNRSNVTTPATSTSDQRGHALRVRAVNSIGAGGWTAAANAPARIPGVPRSLAGTVDGNNTDWAWSAPFGNGGSAITRYDLQWRDATANSWSGNIINNGNSRTYTFTPSTFAGQYQVRVRAVNTVGAGGWSAPVTSTQSKPGAPSMLSGVLAANKRDVAWSWSAPTSTGGSAITRYDIQWRPRGSSSDGTIVAVGTGTSWTFASTRYHSDYELRVRAVNSLGEGPWTARVRAPFRVPLQPHSLTGAAQTNGSVRWTWGQPSTGGSPITSYEYSTRRVAGNWSAWVTRSAANVTLNLNYVYDLRVRAVNSIGEGPASRIVRSPANMPGAVMGLAGAASGADVNWTWTAAAAQGSAITKYEMQWRRDSDAAWSDAINTGTNLAHTITGATVSYLAFQARIRAVNAIGNGEWSSAVNAPARRPEAPSGLGGRGSGQNIAWSWDAVTRTGGSAITRYDIQWRSGSTWSSSNIVARGTATSWSQSVGYSTSREARVRAVNAAGVGPWSAGVSASTGARPVSRPGVPPGLAGVAKDQTITWTWSAASTGGGTISRYELQWREKGFSWAADKIVNAGTDRTEAVVVGYGKTIEARVRAVNTAGEGNWSTLVETTTCSRGTLSGTTTIVVNPSAVYDSGGFQWIMGTDLRQTVLTRDGTGTNAQGTLEMFQWAWVASGALVARSIPFKQKYGTQRLYRASAAPDPENGLIFLLRKPAPRTLANVELRVYRISDGALRRTLPTNRDDNIQWILAAGDNRCLGQNLTVSANRLSVRLWTYTDNPRALVSGNMNLDFPSGTFAGSSDAPRFRGWILDDTLYLTGSDKVTDIYAWTLSGTTSPTATYQADLRVPIAGQTGIPANWVRVAVLGRDFVNDRFFIADRVTDMNAFTFYWLDSRTCT